MMKIAALLFFICLPAFGLISAANANEPDLPSESRSPESILSSIRQKSELADRIVVWVDDDAITLTELEEALIRFQANGDIESPAIDQATLRQALEMLIDETLMLKAASKAGVSAPAEAIDNRVDAMIKQMERQKGGPAGLDAILEKAGEDRDALREKLRDQLRREWTVVRAVSARFTVTDADVAKFGDDQQAKGASSERYYLQHIFFPVAADAAKERWEKVKAMAHDARMEAEKKDDFAAVGQEWVRSHAEDQVEAGSLGAMAPEELMPELAAAVKNLETGQSTPPIRTAKGIHVLYLTRKTTAKQILFAKRFDEAKDKWVKELRNASTIQVSGRLADE